MRKVLLVSYHFPPSSAVGALRPARLARLLPAFGFEVDVICASGSRRRGSNDPSRVALVPEGSRVWRIDTPFVLGRDPHDPPSSGPRMSLAWWKARAYFEWLFLTREWSWHWGQAAGRAATSWLEKEEFDLVVLDGPPNPSVIPAIRAAKRFGVPAVLDLRDLWWCDDQALPPWWRGSPRLRRTRWESELRDEAVRTADRVVLTSAEMMGVMRGWYPDLSASHFSAITNAYGEVDAGLPALEERGSGGRLRLVYTGSLSYGRVEQAKQLIKGMGELRGGDGPEIELSFIGDGGSLLRIAAEEAGVSDRVFVEDWVAQDQCHQDPAGGRRPSLTPALGQGRHSSRHPCEALRLYGPTEECSRYPWPRARCRPYPRVRPWRGGSPPIVPEIWPMR